MQLSYWEIKNWFTNVDFTIVGSGIVGLHTALHLRKRFPKSKILILEKGILPQGASTKNAGFACFGSVSEILADLKNQSEQETFNLIKKRVDGLQLLRNNLGDKKIAYQNFGGYELFKKDDVDLHDNCISKLEQINKFLKHLFNENVYSITSNKFGFKNIQKNLIFNQFEGQIDTGLMMNVLLQKAIKNNILILNNQNVTAFNELNNYVEIITNDYSFKTEKLLFANNGFASNITKNEVKPARAQVLITQPIENLKIKGTFHINEGYYYFRNIDNRILLGGGRNLDFKRETTTKLNTTEKIQNSLKQLLKTVILPKTAHKIDQQWSGIMGIGTNKTPIVTQLSNNVFCGVKMGGMGVAIGSLIGQELADLV